MSELFVGLGIVFWTIGFIKVGFEKANGSVLHRAFVRPPFLIYLICGQPGASNIPRGVMSLITMIAQLQGIFFVVLGVIIYFSSEQYFNLQTFILLLGSIMIYYAGWRIYKKYPYVEEQ